MTSLEKTFSLGQTLSKTGLYSPLSVISLDKNQSKKKNQYAGKDGALLDFIFQIGKDYHRKASLRSGKNNGCKPISHSEVKDKISQRALTLIGGGINTSLSKGVHGKGKSFYCKSRKAFRKKDESKSVITIKLCKLKWDKILLLNQHWNFYMKSTLREKYLLDRTKSLKFLQELEGSKIEWTGAEFFVVSCLAHEEYTGSKGILIGYTKNTWIVATKVSGNEFVKVRVIPKAGSKVEVKMPENFEGSSPVETIYFGIE
mmetsp:Transcript_26462/g.39149  ORF Transcript_26462/g.39149 Transcript_26462/m.39149 type:complete len:258 (-) Transcript_26462:274-1047(-)